jgi:two-component system, OmpR family, phosphate regulon sensor histidine kinase PhoR
VSALKRKLANTDVISKYKLEIPIKIITEGLKHTQKVYHGIYEFTNLVKNNGYLTKKIVNLNAALTDYLDGSSYCNDVIIKDLPNISVSESLFCISIDNLIKNGLRYNDSSTRLVEVSYDKTSNSIHIDDNGRGMNVEDLSILIQPYTRNPLQKESGTGLGLNISVAILKEHGFKLSCTSSKFDTGTRVIISLGNEPIH